MDVRLRLVLHPSLVATVLGGVDRRHVGDLEPLGQRRGGVRHEPVMAVNEVVGALLGKRHAGREHVVVHPLNPRDEPVEVAGPAGLGHAMHGHAAALFQQHPVSTLPRATGEHIHAYALSDERLGQLAHVSRQASLDHGRVLPGEEQHTVAHPRHPISRVGENAHVRQRPAGHDRCLAHLAGLAGEGPGGSRAQSSRLEPMDVVLTTAWEGLQNALLMAWEVWWALVLGFAISAIVQAWVPRERVERALGGGGARSVALATGWARLHRRARTRRSRSPSRCSEGRVGGQRAGVSVRLDQPGVGAGDRAVGADRLAVHARRVRRRDRDDRADDAAAAAVRQPSGWRPRRGRTPNEADTGHQHHTAGRVSCSWRAGVRCTGTALGAGLVGCGPQLPRRLADAVDGDHDRVPAGRVHRPVRATASSSSCSWRTRPRRCRRSRT